MEDEDALRKKRLAEKQKELETKKMEDQLKTMLRQMLDTPGYERMMNVKLSNEELFMTAAKNLMGAFHKLGRTITDKEVLYVLNAIKQRTQHDPKITFNRK